MNDNGCGGTTKAVGVTFVTSPLAFTVITGTVLALPNVPGEKLTVANVIAAAPGPDAVASPVSDVM